jgi:hypothetical protein
MTIAATRRLARHSATLLLACVALLLAFQPTSALASSPIAKGASSSIAKATTPKPKTYTWSGSYRTPDGKVETGDATFTSRPGQTVNPVQLVTHLHISNPYWFVGARGSITVTIYHDTVWGPVAMWTVTHALTACGKTDPTCSSAPSGGWTDLPSARQITKFEKGANYMTVQLALS